MWDAAFVEVARQVGVHCSERGQLLGAIRTRLLEMLTKLVHDRNEELAKMSRAAGKKSEADVRAAHRKAATAMLFRRASAAAQRDSLREDLSNETELRKQTESRLQMDLADVRSHNHLLAKQLAEMRRKLEAANEKSAMPLSYEEVLEAAVASLTRDVTLLTAAHYFTIVPLHETRQRQLLYLQQSRHLLIECGLIASPENGV